MWRESGPGCGTPNGIEGLMRGGHQQRYTYKGFSEEWLEMNY